jgi:lipopolysaccharide exporter
MVLSRILDRSLGFVSMIVLARLLVPADFGLVAMATAVVAILEVIKSFGFDVALIQNSSATRDHYDTAWTCNVILGLLIAGVLLALAVPAARFYGQPNVTGVMLCLALVASVSGFENVGVVAFRKEMQFNKDFNLFLANRIIAFAVTIPLAFALRNYWALVLGTLVGRTAYVTLTYVAHPFRPRFSLAQRGEFFHFGKWLVTSTVVNCLRRAAPIF